MKNFLGLGILALALASCGTTVPAQTTEAATQEAALLTQAIDCNASSSTNLNLTADTFISKCRKASIRQVFPGQHYSDTVLSIKNGSSSTQKTAWKLLNDNRFSK